MEKHRTHAEYKVLMVPLADGRMAPVLAGPTYDLPLTHHLVRCAAEIPVREHRVAYDVATGDFTPFDREKVFPLIPEILKDISTGRRLYVGCMGGIGRTGTLLAMLVAHNPAFSAEQAIAYVRQNYNYRAVETHAQALQVADFIDYMGSNGQTGSGGVDAELTEPNPSRVITPVAWFKAWFRG